MGDTKTQLHFAFLGDASIHQLIRVFTKRLLCVDKVWVIFNNHARIACFLRSQDDNSLIYGLFTLINLRTVLPFKE